MIAQQTLSDSIRASSRLFPSYPGGGYGKQRDIVAAATINQEPEEPSTGFLPYETKTKKKKDSNPRCLKKKTQRNRGENRSACKKRNQGFDLSVVLEKSVENQLPKEIATKLFERKR